MEKQTLHATKTTTEQEEQSNHFSEDLGRIFEIGFNTGFLTAINQHKKVKTHFGDLYKNDLSHLRIQSFLNKMYERTGVISQVDKEILRRWVLFRYTPRFG